MQLRTENFKSTNMQKRSYLLLLTLLLSTGIFAQQDRVKLDGVAAVIGKNIVLYSEVAAYKTELEQQSEGKVQASDCEVLEDIMDRKLLAHHAVIDSLTVSEAEVNGVVDQKLAYLLRQLGSEERLYTFYGFNDMDDMRKEFIEVEKEAALVNKEQQKITEDVDVTPEEVRNYYRSLEKENNVPEIGAEIQLAQIVMNVNPTQAEEQRIIDRLNEIKKQVENGESFKMKAILYSQDPGVTQNSGLYTITRESPFVKEFKEAAFGLNEGEVSEPFKSPFGYHILQVEKIRGKQRDVRHILIQPEISDAQLEKAKDSLQQIRKDILTNKISFEDAVLKYSDEKISKANKGILINPETNDSYFDLTKMDPALYARISVLKPGDLTDVFYDETREGEKMFKILLLKSKTDAHIADLNKDYVKLQSLALQKKKAETVAKWIKDKIGDTYIKINDDYKDCKFKDNWFKSL